MRILLTAFLLASLFYSALGQDSLSEPYYTRYYDQLGLYTYGIMKFNHFTVKGQEDKEGIEHSSNENLNLGFGFNYKWMGLGVAFNLGSVNDDSDRYGKTKNLDLQADLYGKNWIWAGVMSFYQGYYWRNADDYIDGWDMKDSAVVRPDVETFTIGASGIYAFNSDKYSLKAAYVNTEKQLRRAGSWLLGGSVNFYYMHSDSTIIPKQLDHLYPDSLELTSINSLTLGAAFGYGYTFVIKKHFYINASLLIGINVQSVEASGIDDESFGRQTKISSNMHSRFGMGWNKDKWYLGIAAISDGFNIKQSEDAEFNYSYGRVRFFYGRRFSISPKK